MSGETAGASDDGIKEEIQSTEIEIPGMKVYQDDFNFEDGDWDSLLAVVREKIELLFKKTPVSLHESARKMLNDFIANCGAVA